MHDRFSPARDALPNSVPSPRLRFRFGAFALFAKLATAHACPEVELRHNWNFFKILFDSNGLSSLFHHDCVLFVQHISENGSNGALVRRSVVACAELFMDVDRATEGGIPRSSR
ncbi:MAG TPA: hypothetical protein VE865_05380 [Bradyrhizobium sp.]|nr:hypothetical protein [Bradyrhizobium sp.]